MKRTILVLYGGKSVEHDISLQTAFSVLNALDKEKYIIIPVYITRQGKWSRLGPLNQPVHDVSRLVTETLKTVSGSIADLLVEFFGKDEQPIVFPLLHGKLGEDGTVQGLLELLDVPYIGNGVLSSAVGIDKEKTKVILKQAGILQAQSITIRSYEWAEFSGQAIEHIENQIGYPCYVKPARLGSSVGINVSYRRDELRSFVDAAFEYDDKVLIEPEIIGREMQVAVIGNEQPQASVVGEYRKERPFMDYNAKYVDGKLVPVVPAEVPLYVQEEMRRIAVRAFKALDCYGLAQVDFFVTKSYELIVNEVNTMPGFTAYSMFPALWEKTDGTTFEQLLEKLISLALARYEEKYLIPNLR